MTKVIILQSDSLESYYEQTLDYLDAKYHSYPSDSHNLLTSTMGGSLEDTPDSAGWNENLARNIANQAVVGRTNILGKQVI